MPERLRWRSVVPVSRDAEDVNQRLLRARDAMDRAYAEPLDVRTVAAVAHISETLRERGVSDFTQEPIDHFYGTDMGLRDPFGNAIRILERKTAAATTV